MTGGQFLDVFFGAGNRLGWPEVSSRPRLKALVDTFDTELRQPAVLPRMVDQTQRVTWYLLAFDDDDFRRTSEELQGFIGPTYARWEEPRSTHARHDEIEE